MKFKGLFTATGACLFASSLILSNTAQAAVSDAEVQKMLLQEQKLEQKVEVLTEEVQELRQQQGSKTVSAPAHRTAKHHTITQVKASQSTQQMSGGGVAPAGSKEATSTGRRPPQPAPASGEDNFQKKWLTSGFIVTTSPYLGLRSAYDATDLVVNLSTMNEDLRLLQQRQKLDNQLAQEGINIPGTDRPMIELSGGVEGTGSYVSPYKGNTISEFDLTRIELDTLSYVSDWATAFISLRYDNAPFPGINNGGTATIGQINGSGQEIANSRVFVRRAWVTIGNLDKSPFYMTLGQMFSPFGIYTSQMLSSPMTQQLGQDNNRMALLGFNKDGFYAEGYAFNSATNVGNNLGIDNGGGNVGYQYSGDKFGYNIGAGYIGNIADSNGMQNTGASSVPLFTGFGFNNSTEILQKRVPGADVHGELDIGKLTLLGEYTGATTNFAQGNMSFDNHGATPKALHTEGDYNFTMFHWPSVFTLAYDHSWQGLPIGLPQNSYIVDLTTSIWKDTIEELEFRHDVNYPKSDRSSGNVSFNPPFLPISIPSVGGTQNTVLLQIGAYF